MHILSPLSPSLSSQRGLTLLEIMVAIVILTVGAIAFLGTFSGIARSIRVSKARTLASNLAQEKIESLKNVSYYRLLVTSAAVMAPETGLGSFYYDDGYYPEEDLLVGQIPFKRRVFIQKVNESAGVIVGNTWNASDTGLKLITAYVVWQEGSVWRKVQVNNLRDNPNRQQLDGTVTGTVRSGGTPVSGVAVYTLQNLLYAATTDASGQYTINLPAGIYDFHAGKRGYFTAIVRSTATASAIVTVDLAISPIATGNIQGFAYLVDHIVISEVCATVDGDDAVEYYELYNPTPNAFVMFNAGAPSYRIEGNGTGGGSFTTMTPPSEMIYVNTVIPPHGYFLFASSPTVKGVTADAYYSDPTRTMPTPVDRFPKEEAGGLRLVSEGVNESSGTTIDALGWDRGSSPWGPAGFRESNGFHLPAGPAHGGLEDGETIERMAYSTSTHVTMDSAGVHASFGNGYDSDDNDADFVYHNHSDSESPQGSANAENPGAGTPAISAAAFVDDALSVSAVAIGVPMPGSFTVTNVATGTWNIVVSSRGYVYSQQNIPVAAGVQVNLGSVFLTAPATEGYLSGRVLNSGGAPLNMIKVESSFGVGDYTDSAGYYRFEIGGGTHIVTANPNNLSSSLYTTGEATDVVVNAGEARTVPDIFLFQGGTIRGFVSSNGTDPLPGIPVISTSVTGAEVGVAVTDSNGYFRFSNLPVGIYGVTPQLEIGESATPMVFSATVTAGGNVFAGTMTVSNAFGTIEGTAQTGGHSITTGVLIIAVALPTSISGAYPPTNTQTLRDSGVVYYIGSSDSDGTYAVRVRGGATYNVYAWYTTFSGSTPNPQKRDSTATLVAGGNAVVNFTW